MTFYRTEDLKIDSLNLELQFICIRQFFIIFAGELGKLQFLIYWSSVLKNAIGIPIKIFR